ncbi:MAG: hypothetical protein MHM6MM_004613 [Cercozoa sp. M6MM]
MPRPRWMTPLVRHRSFRAYAQYLSRACFYHDSAMLRQSGAKVRAGVRCMVTAAQAEQKMIPLNINGTEYQVPEGITILQACERVGIRIPRYCYHERLSVSGNCRMCLVEIVGPPAPAAACAYPVSLAPGGKTMQVRTDSPKAKKAREGVMEFLLANHPLDCPICDQGGECDLQDQYRMFGAAGGRFREAKVTVEDQYIGPLVKMIMTRCIKCTRCVRFADQIAGVPVLGMTGRGVDAEIGTYVNTKFDSELSGNVIDLCPVGALTSMATYQMQARPWELRSVETVDVHDAVGSNIIVDVRGQQILRIKPRVNDSVNEEWLGDKARFALDGLRRQRLDTPLLRNSEGMLAPSDWLDAMRACADVLNASQPEDVHFVAGDMCDAETLVAAKDLCNRLGSDNTHLSTSMGEFDASNRLHYTFEGDISSIDEADAVLLVGTNPRMEAPVLNARIRQRTLNLPSLRVANM